MEIKYCVICKKRLPNKILGFNLREKVYEFEDGSYCEKCAKVIIDKRRK